MAMSIGAMNIPQTGAYEIDANGNLIPAIVYGATAAMPTVPTSGAFSGQPNGGYQLNTLYNTPAPATAAAPAAASQPVYGGGSYSTGMTYDANAALTNGYSANSGYSANPFDNVRPARMLSPQYTSGSSQVLYGHYAPTSSMQSMTGAELRYNAQQQGTAAPTTGGGAAPTKDAAAPAAGGGAAPAAETKKKEAPKADAKKAAPKTVTVAAGDSLSAIAAKHGTTWQKLYELNKAAVGSNPNLIHPGLKLKLP